MTMTVPELPPELAPETLEFIFEHVKDAPDTQLLAQEALDGKIVQIFAAAGVILGLAGLADLPELNNFAALVLSAAVASFVVVATATGYSIWVRRFRTARHVEEIWQRHWMKSPHALRHMLVSDIARAYSANETLLRHKSDALRVALTATAVEVFLVGSLLIWSILASPAPRTPAQTPQAVAVAEGVAEGVDQARAAAALREARSLLLHPRIDTNRHAQ